MYDLLHFSITLYCRPASCAPVCIILFKRHRKGADFRVSDVKCVAMNSLWTVVVRCRLIAVGTCSHQFIFVGSLAAGADVATKARSF